MNIAVKDAEIKPAGWGKSFFWLVLAVACFNAAYISIKFPTLGLFIFGYAYFLVQLTDQPTVRRAFYFGLATGFLCAASQLFFFWNIFGATAIVLWIVFAFWIGLVCRHFLWLHSTLGKNQGGMVDSIYLDRP